MEDGLACSLLHEPDLCDRVRSLGLNEAHFFYDEPRKMFVSVCDMWDAGKPVSFRTLIDFLKHDITTEMVNKLGVIAEAVPSGKNWEYYLTRVMDNACGRMVLSLAINIPGDITSGSELADTMFSRIETAKRLSIPSRPSTCADLASRVYKECVEAHMNDGRVESRILTGLRPIDDCGGLEVGDFMVIGGWKSSGKSALVENLVVRMLRDQYASGVSFFSYEMTSLQQMRRMMAIISGKNPTSFGSGLSDDDDLEAMKKAGESLSMHNLFIEDSPDFDCGRLRVRARELSKAHKCNVCVVDYIQLVPTSVGKNSVREQEVAHVSRTLKLLAREIGGVVIGLSQLNADGETRESRSLEQDADIVLKIQPAKVTGRMDIVIDKYRNAEPNQPIRMDWANDSYKLTEI